MKRYRKGIWIALTILVLGPFVVPIFIPWTGVNCRQQYINIKTGQARFIRRLWFIPISIRTKDTPLSLALQGERIDVAKIPSWHKVNTFSPTPGVKHSPHHRFHGALSQAHEVELIYSMLAPTPERKRQIASDILRAWQSSGSDNGADNLLIELEKEVSNKVTQGIGEELAEP